jgi:drug/metabolite transporter (DMT)-like permease
MWHAVLLGLLGGVLGGNALPHFVRGITRRRYPSALGNGPLPNLVAGWAGLVLAGSVLAWAHLHRHPLPAFGAVALGVLLIGLFHAGPGAFGRPEAADPPDGYGRAPSSP